MSVIFNEAVFHHLVADQAGPMGLALERVSNQIAGNFEAAFGIIFATRDQTVLPTADYEITTGDRGIQSVIGIPANQGSVSEYLDEKLGVIEADRWIDPLMTNWDSYI